MKITINKIEKPLCSSFTMFEKLNIDQLKQDKEITIEVNNETKTRLSTTFKYKEFHYKINQYVDGYNLHKDENYSFFTYEKQVSYYFKLSKKQNMTTYECYLKDLLKQLFKETLKIKLDSLKVNLIDYTN